jgi:Exostosin family
MMKIKLTLQLLCFTTAGFLTGMVVNNIRSFQVGGQFIFGSLASSFTTNRYVATLESKHEALSKWSPQSLIQANISSVLLVPESEWPNTTKKDSATTATCPLRFFVYDNIAANFSSDLEDKVIEAIKAGSSHDNPNVDLALVKLFRTSPCKTTDPAQADLFVVPYLHCSHCIFGGYAYQAGCRQVPDSEISLVRQSLDYFNANESTREKHIFLASWGGGMTKRKIDRSPMILTVGPKSDRNNGVLVPMVNARPEFQPSVLHSRSEDWWTRPRKYIFSYFYGKANPRMSRGHGGRRFRVYFGDDIDRYAGGNTSLAGMPFLSHEISKKNFNEQEALNAYGDSVFCPVLAGDLCWQKRFYDVILSGCLPVVLEWTDPNRPEDWRTWFTPSGAAVSSVEECYPFMKGQFGNDDSIEIDYDEFVVRAPGNASNEEDVSSLRLTMEQLGKDTSRIHEMQLALMTAAQRMSFGLGVDAHQSNDAFAHILRALAHVVAQKGNTTRL